MCSTKANTRFDSVWVSFPGKLGSLSTKFEETVEIWWRFDKGWSENKLLLSPGHSGSDQTLGRITDYQLPLFEIMVYRPWLVSFFKMWKGAAAKEWQGIESNVQLMRLTWTYFFGVWLTLNLRNCFFDLHLFVTPIFVKACAKASV